MTAIHITKELEAAVQDVFERLEAHGCVGRWGDDPTKAAKARWDACASLVDEGITTVDVAAAYGAILAMPCIQFRRWPSNRELLDAINSRRPHASEAAVKAEATRIFQAIVKEVSSGRHRDLDLRVRETFGLAAAEALAAVGGRDRINHGADYLGAIWTSFSAAYVSAVAGGRDRGDATKALPAPKPLEIAGQTEEAAVTGPTRIAGRLGDLLRPSPRAGETLPPVVIRVAPPVDREARIAQLQRQAQELLQEAK